METLQRPARALLSLVALALVVGCAGCSTKAGKEKALREAAADYDSGQLERAEIEYKNLLQTDSRNAEAIAGLGLVYFDQGVISKAAPFLGTAHLLRPQNLRVQLKLGLIYRDIGKLDDARSAALRVLEKEPLNEQALLLLVESSVASKDAEDTGARLKRLVEASPHSSAAALAIGAFEFRQHDLAGAERDVRRALALDSSSAQAHSALGALLTAKRDFEGAEASLSKAASLAPARSPLQIQYAQFKIRMRDVDGALRLVEAVTQKAPDYLPALTLRSEILANQGKLDAALDYAAKVLARDPVNPEAMLLHAQLQRAKGENEKAISELEAALRNYPHSSEVFRQLGQTYLMSGDLNKAVENLVAAVNLAPEAPEAVLLLAEANLRKGDYSDVAAALKDLVQKHPDIPQGWLLLASADKGLGDLDAALDVYAQMERLYKRNPETSLYIGMIQLAQKKRDEARASFARSLEASQDFLPALEQLINMDLQDGAFPSALRRANDEIARRPQQALPQMLLAKVYLAQGKLDEAEAALQRAVALQPDFPTAYLLLARLYSETNRQQKALANLQSVLARNPKDESALMLSAIIYEKQGDFASARDAYEKILSVDRRFSSALNNLAYLYSERLSQNDKAFEMAQRARELLPTEPHTADTLGWILYKRRQYPWALDLLKESAEKLPTEPDVLFHLAMTRYMMGDEALAKAGFEAALKERPLLDGHEEALQRLAILAIDPAAAPAGAVDALEKALLREPQDPVALARIAAIHARSGSVDKAVGEYLKAIAASPANVATQVALARLYASQGKLPQALDLAKQARKLQPEDPDVGALLGRLAFATGDFTWAYSLAQESARARPDDPEVMVDLARAAYSNGQVAEAESALRHALSSGAAGAKAQDAAQFLNLVTLARKTDLSPDEDTLATEQLKSDPRSAPALMVHARFLEQAHRTDEAFAAYVAVLKVFPGFSPAKRKVALLGADDPTKDALSYAPAIEAREAYPDDAAVAKALGILNYRRKNYQRAADLLTEGTASGGNDAQAVYYLGKSHYALQDTTDGRQELTRALKLGLPEELAADARRSLAESR